MANFLVGIRKIVTLEARLNIEAEDETEAEELAKEEAEALPNDANEWSEGEADLTDGIEVIGVDEVEEDDEEDEDEKTDKPQHLDLSWTKTNKDGQLTNWAGQRLRDPREWNDL